MRCASAGGAAPPSRWRRTSDGGDGVVRLTGNSADRQEPDPIRPRQDLAPSRRPDPDDVTGVQRVPVTIDFYVGRTTQRDVDLFLPELVGRRITGSLREWSCAG